MQQDQAEAILAECRRQRARAVRWAGISGVLIVALVAVTALAAASGRYHGLIVFLVPVLLVMNLMRIVQCSVALRKIRNAERLVLDAQSRLTDQR